MTMPPELITGITGLVGAALGTWNARQGRQIRELQDKLGSLSGWRQIATEYIGNLFFVLTSRGITPPPPPALLGLMVPPTPVDPTGRSEAHDAAPGNGIPETRS